MHGGSTHAGTVAAHKEVAVAAIERRGLYPERGEQVTHMDPRDVLAEEMWRTQCAVMVLQGLVNDLGLVPGTIIEGGPEDGGKAAGIYGRTYHVSGLETGEAKPHVLWSMLLEERRHLKAIAVDCAKAGVEAHRMEVSAQMASMVNTLFRAVFGDERLGMTPDVVQGALAIAADHLRQLPAAGA
jgi:hypothetical protein